MLNPMLTDALSAIDVCTPVFSGMVGIDDHMRFYPDLCTVVPTVRNGLVKREGAGMEVIYHLRPGVKWHDGAPFTSHDVWFNWKYVMDPRVLVTSRDGYDLITAVDTPDPLTAVVHYKLPYGPYLGIFSLPSYPMLPAHLLEHSPDPQHDAFNRAPIGTGPFRFVRWEAGEDVELAANPDYYRGKPRLKHLFFKFVPDDNAAFIQLTNGDVDVYSDFNLDQKPPLARYPDVSLSQVPSLTFEQLSFNLDDPILKDVIVRRAIAHAIDKAQISKTVYRGLWPVATCTEHPLAWDFPPHHREPYPYDPAKARKMLAVDGWLPGPDGIRVKDGKRLALTIMSTAGRKTREEDELILKGYLQAIGIDLSIQNTSGELLFAAYPAGLLQAGKYQCALFAWSSSVDPADNLSLWSSTQIPPRGENTCRIRDPELDRVLLLGERTLDEAARRPYYLEMTRILDREEPLVPLVYWTELHGVNRQLRNFRPNPTSSRFLWNCQDWYISPRGGQAPPTSPPLSQARPHGDLGALLHAHRTRPGARRAKPVSPEPSSRGHGGAFS